jgi:hypothetical protein
MGESRLHYGMSLRLYFEEKAFGPGMVMLLREVERTGSLQKAAKAMNMAYSKAWKMLKGAVWALKNISSRSKPSWILGWTWICCFRIKSTLLSPSVSIA